MFHVQEVILKFDKQLNGTVYMYDKWIHRHQKSVDAKEEYFEMLRIN